MKERLIISALPSHHSFFNASLGDLAKEMFCITYQFNVDKNGYGPYGFNSELANLFLQKLFFRSLCWTENGKELIEFSKFKSSGLIFYGNDIENEYLTQEVEKVKMFLLFEKKRKLFEKYDKIATLNPMPILIKLYSENGKIDMNTFIELKSEYSKISIVKFIDVWKLYIFTEKESIVTIEKTCNDIGLEIQNVTNFENIKAH